MSWCWNFIYYACTLPYLIAEAEIEEYFKWCLRVLNFYIKSCSRILFWSTFFNSWELFTNSKFYLGIFLCLVSFKIEGFAPVCSLCSVWVSRCNLKCGTLRANSTIELELWSVLDVNSYIVDCGRCSLLIFVALYRILNFTANRTRYFFVVCIPRW